MNWQSQLNGDTLSWLLEEENPGVRYLALRDLLKLPVTDPDLIVARDKAHREGPIATILDAMHPNGYWVRPGAGYSGKYKSAVWSLIMLAQLGAKVEMDKRILLACRYLVDHALTEHGQFSMNGAPSGTIDCLQGNLTAALLDLEYQDERLDKAFEWLACSVSGEGIASVEDKQSPLRYYAYNCGPLFACGFNNKLSCAWGGTKVLLALGKIPPERKTTLIDNAILAAIDFFLAIDPLMAAYPTRLGGKPSRNWWKLGFPVFYVTDILQLLEALIEVGLAQDPRLIPMVEFILSKQDNNGRWLLEHEYKTWVDFGRIKQPNKWVTIRALSVLKNAISD